MQALLLFIILEASLSSAVCLYGCCGLKMELPSSSFLLSTIHKSERSAGMSSFQVDQPEPFISCCPCDDYPKPTPNFTTPDSGFTSGPDFIPGNPQKIIPRPGQDEPIDKPTPSSSPKPQFCLSHCCGRDLKGKDLAILAPWQNSDDPHPAIQCCPDCNDIVRLDQLALTDVHGLSSLGIGDSASIVAEDVVGKAEL